MPPRKKEPEAVAAEAPVPAPQKPAPVFVEDAGARLAFDRAGPPMNTGLTEGKSNFATITQTARESVLPKE